MRSQSRRTSDCPTMSSTWKMVRSLCVPKTSSGGFGSTQRRLIDGLLVEYGTFVGQLPRSELSTSDGNQLSFCKRFPPFACQGNARKQRNKLIVALDREPISHNASLAVLTMFLEQHETWGFHPAGVGMLAPMSVRKENVTV